MNSATLQYWKNKSLKGQLKICLFIYFALSENLLPYAVLVDFVRANLVKNKLLKLIWNAFISC